MNNIETIPEGRYCYDESHVCPYWSIREDLPKQENGFCSFLNKSDWDINEEMGELEELYTKTKIPAHEITMSLLWDQCKECDIKLGDENDR